MESIYVLEYDGENFHKNHLENAIPLKFEHELYSNGYLPLTIVCPGTKLESLLQVMIHTIRHFSGLKPELGDITDLVDVCKDIASK